MMKRNLIIVTTALLAMLAGNVYAANATRIGVLDMHVVMAEAPQVKLIRENLQNQFKSREEAIVKQQDAFKQNAEKLRKDASILSKADAEKMQKKVINEQQALQKDQAAFQQDVMKAQNTAIKGFIDNVKAIVSKIAKKQSLDVVLTKDMIAFVDDKLDITQQVMSQLKKSS